MAIARTRSLEESHTATTVAGLTTTVLRFPFCTGLAGLSPSRRLIPSARQLVLLMLPASGATVCCPPFTTLMTSMLSEDQQALTYQGPSQFTESGNSQSCPTRTPSFALLSADGSGQALPHCRRV